MATTVANEALQRIAEGLTRAFPDVGTVMPLRLLGEGFRSLAVETTGGVVFRIGNSEAAAVGYRSERHLLPQLCTHVPVAIPMPHWYVETSADFPYGVIGYPKIAGASLSPQLLVRADARRIAADIAAFLVAMHQFPVDDGAALGKQASADESFEAIRNVVLHPLRDTLSHDEYRVVVGWWDAFLRDRRMRRYRPVLRHGDLWYEHILVDETGQGVVGVLDFERVAIGDPAQDFATQLHLGEAFLGLVIHAYTASGGSCDAGFDHRVQRLWEFREFDGIHLAVEANDVAELGDAIAKLRRGPLFQSHVTARVKGGERS